VIKIENGAKRQQEDQEEKKESMSLEALKETLRPCSTQEPSSSSAITQTQRNSILSHYDSLFPIHRKPPKSSLSDQLRRLNDSLSPSHSKTLQQEKEKEELLQEEEPEIERAKFASVKLPQFQFDHTGPFEPLLLSSHGEFPVVQVVNFSFSVVRFSEFGINLWMKI